MSKEIHDKNVFCLYLNKLIDSELDKNEPDMEFIDECNAFLDGIENGKYEPNPVIKRRELQELYKSYHSIYGENSNIKSKHRFRNRFSKIAVAACFCLIMLAIPVTVAAYNGFSPADILNHIGNKLFSWEIGEDVEIEGMTFIRNGEATQYDDITECIAQEKLDIYYPSWLPNDVYVKSVTIIPTSNGEQMIIKFTDELISMDISLYRSDDPFEPENFRGDITEINGNTVYYVVDENKIWGTVWLDGYQYSVIASDFETMLNIFNGLKR